jgi:hypothetical protein
MTDETVVTAAQPISSETLFDLVERVCAKFDLPPRERKKALKRMRTARYRKAVQDPVITAHRSIAEAITELSRPSPSGAVLADQVESALSHLSIAYLTLMGKRS